MQPLQRIDRRAGSARRIRQFQRQFLCGGRDLVHRDSGQITSEGQHLDAAGRGAERLRQIGLRVDGLQPRADHGNTRSSGGCNGYRGCDLYPGGKRSQPGIGNLGFF
ncbi:hypothetical protein GALL_544480 [mine drainage metagenome]|uniref:Uncharacterized protein n=1 Tax=mine drainage metagenome TaxID=410659 RepID=A0A1J5P951_9ZZZZ